MITHRIAIALAGTICMVVAAHPETFTSGPRQTTLIELYSSEGCSSCPPAEKRMNAFINDQGLWKEFVPVAFHVDYWNYIGWTDRFSSQEFSNRQRQYSKAWKSGTIYTPCFVRNGKTDRTPSLSVGSNEPGVLEATISNGQIAVRFTAKDAALKKFTAWVAPLTGKTTTDVKAGENRGRTLEHGFVALGLEHTAMEKDGDAFTAMLPFERNEDAKAVAVWISRSDSLTPIQATGGWLR